MIDYEAQESARQISDTVTNLRATLEKTATLLNKAIEAMSDLHAHITPPEDENEEFNAPTVSVAALKKFVDVHAELVYERHHLAKK